MSLLSEEDFARLVRSAPLVSIDLILSDAEGCILVARRTNKPAQNFYFVPGGSIRKNETIVVAYQRILKAETGLETPFGAARMLGVYDHIYPENRFGGEDFSTHYVALGYELAFSQRPDVRLDAQHSGYHWMGREELLASPEVHANTKAYVRRDQPL